MKKITVATVTILFIAFTSCNNKNVPNPEKIKVCKTTNQNQKNMKNIVSIVEIATDDFSRAVKFYESILGITIEEIDMEGTQMGVLPSDGESVNVVLVKGNEYTPSSKGTVVYLNAGNDLQPMLDNIEKNGGQIIVSKTEISPEIGFFALFIDTEGNRIGLHSIN